MHTDSVGSAGSVHSLTSRTVKTGWELMDTADTGRDCYFPAESLRDVAAVNADISHGDVADFTPLAHGVPTQKSPPFFCPFSSAAVFTDHHFRHGSGDALCLPMGTPAAAGHIIRSFLAGGRVSDPQESLVPE